MATKAGHMLPRAKAQTSAAGIARSIITASQLAIAVTNARGNDALKDAMSSSQQWRSRAWMAMSIAFVSQ